jgi:hypothetical protein
MAKVFSTLLTVARKCIRIGNKCVANCIDLWNNKY